MHNKEQVGIIEETGELIGAGSESEQRDQAGGVLIGCESDVKAIEFGSLFDGHSTGFVVGGKEHKGLAVGGGEIEYFADCGIEIEHFFYGIGGVVFMACPIDLGSFEHKKKSFFAALAQERAGHSGGEWQVISSVLDAFGFFGCGEPGKWFVSAGFELIEAGFGIISELVSHCVQFLVQVSLVAFALLEVIESATDEQVEGCLNKKGCNCFHICPIGHMSNERGRGCVGDAAAGNESGSQSLRASLFEDGAAGFFVFIHADGAVVGFTTASQCGSGGAGIGN